MMGCVAVWDLAEFTLLSVRAFHRAPACGGSVVAVWWQCGGVIVCWQCLIVQWMQVLPRAHQHPVIGSAVLCSGDSFITAGRDGSVLHTVIAKKMLGKG